MGAKTDVMETITKKLKNILVPTDFSKQCDNAFDHAVKIADNKDAVIYLLHIIEDKDAMIYGSNFLEMDIVHEKRKNTASVLHNYIALKQQSNVIPVIREGDLYENIKLVAEEVNADTIILGTHGKKGMQKLFGSYALKVVDKTDRPVLVVQDAPLDDPYANLLFPVSLHTEDRQKAEVALKYSKEYGSKIHILLEAAKNESEKVKQESIKRQLTHYFSKHGALYTLCVSEVWGSEFEIDIEKYAKETNSGMILILNDASKHYFMGGGKEENLLFNDSHIPVLCVHPKKLRSTSMPWALTGV